MNILTYFISSSRQRLWKDVETGFGLLWESISTRFFMDWRYSDGLAIGLLVFFSYRMQDAESRSTLREPFRFYEPKISEAHENLSCYMPEEKTENTAGGLFWIEMLVSWTCIYSNFSSESELLMIMNLSQRQRHRKSRGRVKTRLAIINRWRVYQCIVNQPSTMISFCLIVCIIKDLICIIEEASSLSDS